MNNPYEESNEPIVFENLSELIHEAANRREAIIPKLSYLNMTFSVARKIEDGLDVYPNMLKKYFELIGHSCTVTMEKDSKPLPGELEINKLSEAAILASKSSLMPNKTIALHIGKKPDYLSLKGANPSFETCLNIFDILGYELRFNLYSHGTTQAMIDHLNEARAKILAKNAKARALKYGSDNPNDLILNNRQKEAQVALESLFHDK